MQRSIFFMFGLDKTTGKAWVQACNEKTKEGKKHQGFKKIGV
jgi:hypothetical protein